MFTKINTCLTNQSDLHFVYFSEAKKMEREDSWCGDGDMATVNLSLCKSKITAPSIKHLYMIKNQTEAAPF